MVQGIYPPIYGLKYGTWYLHFRILEVPLNWFLFAQKIVASRGISRWRSWTERDIELCGTSGQLGWVPVATRWWMAGTKNDAVNFVKRPFFDDFGRFFSAFLSFFFGVTLQSTVVNIAVFWIWMAHKNHGFLGCLPDLSEGDLHLPVLPDLRWFEQIFDHKSTGRRI